MHPIVGVKIENRHLAELLPLKSRGEGLLKLTTLKSDQSRAAIKVFIVKNRKKDLLTEFLLHDLRRGSSRTPAIDLEAAYNGRFRLLLTLKLNGRVQETRTIPLGAFMPGRIITRRVIPPLFAALLALLFFLFLLPRLQETPEAPRPAEAFSRGSSTNRETAAEGPPPAVIPEAKPEKEPAPKPRQPEQAQEPADINPEPAAPAPEPEAAAPPESPPPEQPVIQRTEASAAVFDAVTVYFGPDEARLNTETRRQLAEIVDDLASYPGPVSITGHCASFGTETGRMDLSRQRAHAVYGFLRDSGWKPESEPAIEGHGSSRPAVEDPERQYLNRRVEIKPKY